MKYSNIPTNEEATLDELHAMSLQTPNREPLPYWKNKEAHTTSDNTAIEDAARRTYDIAVRNLRDAVEDYIHSPTVYKCKYITACTEAVLHEEFQDLQTYKKTVLAWSLE